MTNPTGPRDSFDIEKVQLEVFKYMTQTSVSGEMVRQARVMASEMVAENLTYILETKVAGWRHDNFVALPASRKDWLKEQFLPEWFRKLFGVRVIYKRWDAKALFPDFPIPDRHLGLPMIDIEEFKLES